MTEPIITLPAAFRMKAEAHPDRVALRTKALGLWREITWNSYAASVQAVAAGLLELGVASKEAVGVIAENRAEWLYADLGILTAGGVTCAMYGTSAPEQVGYIAQHAGLRVVFAEDEEQLDKLLQVREQHPLARIVVMEKKGLSGFSDPGVMFFDELTALGEARLARGAGPELEARVANLDPSALAILVYTSGTTGNPKGVMLSHGNIVWACRALAAVTEVQPEDEQISFLPLCHVAERIITVFNQVVNGSVVSFAESLDTVQVDLTEVRPHFFFAVPRVWEKMQNAVELRMREASFTKRAVHEWAVRVGREATPYLRAGTPLPPALAARHALAERTELYWLRERLGLDRARLAVSAAAPISGEVIEWFQAIGVPMVEAYGLTESTAIITANGPGFPEPGCVGRPVGSVELRLAEDGEILARSPGVMMGYYREEEATREAVDEEGWLHTGDVGELDAQGFLRITDRKKDLIITAGGKNVAPQLIESKLRSSPYIHDAIVLGDRKKFLVALIVLDEDNVLAWAQKQRAQAGSYAELARSDEVQALVRAEVDRVNDTLTHVEAVKRFHVLDRRLDREEGELTPTLKVRRKVIGERYREVVEALYR